MRLMRTTSFRFTAFFILLLMVALGLIGTFIYRATVVQVLRSVDERIITEVEDLAKIYEIAGFRSLRGTINRRMNLNPQLNPEADSGIYLLVDTQNAQRRTGNMSVIPDAVVADEQLHRFTYEQVVYELNNFTEPKEIQKRTAVGKVRRLYDSRTGQQSAILFVARDITDLVAIQTAAREAITRAAIITILAGLLIGFLSSRAFLTRVDNVNKTAAAIRSGDLTRRVPLTGAEDEFDSLAENLNAMLDQIERLMNGMRQVSDNIAHDLRSPLTRIRSRLESSLADPSVDRDEVLAKTSMDVDRLLATFNALLSITRIESGESSRKLDKVNLLEVVSEVMELYEPAAQENGFELDLSLQPTLPVLGSRELISQALSNMLDNAFKYGRDDDSDITPRIRVKVAPRVGGGALLSVEDNGPGVLPEDRERILNRFVRLEQSRSTQGSGLGLSMVTAIARFHNAQLSVGPGLQNVEGKLGLDEADKYGLGIRLAFPPAPKNMFDLIKEAGKEMRPN